MLNLLTCRSQCSNIWVSIASGIMVLTGPSSFTFAIQVDAVETQSDGVGADTLNAPIAADLFQFPPTQPEELIQAARTTQRLNRVSDSRAFLSRFISLQLSETELRSVRAEIGPREFLELRRDQRLKPEAEQVLKLVNAASASKTASLEDIQAAAGKLRDQSFAGDEARRKLVANPDIAASVLLALEPSSPEGQIADSLLEEHITGFRSSLLVSLSKQDLTSAARARVIRLLGMSADRQTGDRLLRWQFDQDPSTAAFARQSIATLHGSSLLNDTPEAASSYLTEQATKSIRIAVDRFSPLRPSVAMEDLKMIDPRQPSLQRSVDLLTDAVALTPGDQRTRSLLLVAKTETVETSLESPTSITPETSTTELVAALSEAVDLGCNTAAAEILKALSSRSFEDDPDGSQSRVFRNALQSPDPAVRFLAAIVVNKRPTLDVSNSLLRDAIATVKSGATKPEAVVVTGEDRVLDDLTFALQEAGFHVAKAQSAPDGFDAAVSQMNCELFLISAEATRWPLAATLANLRSDYRTRSVPVVVFGPQRFESQVHELSKIYPGVWFTSQPIGTSLKTETKPVQEQFGRINTTRLKLLLQLDSLNLPDPTLSSSNRVVMQAMLN